LNTNASFHCEKRGPVGVVMFLWLCREGLSQTVKSEILMSKSETNSNLECSNDRNKSSTVESGKRVLRDGVSVIWIFVI